MAKRIKKINVASDKKGTVKNPYTVEEHEQMLAEGQWTENGFVEELGLVEGEGNNDPGQNDAYSNEFESEEEKERFKAWVMALYLGSINSDSYCAYWSASQFIEGPDSDIAVEYALHLHSRGKSYEQIAPYINNGIPLNEIDDYIDFINEKYNKSFSELEKNDMLSELNEKKKLKLNGIALVNNSSHAIVVNCTIKNSMDEIKYTDGSFTGVKPSYTINDISKFYAK